MNNSMYNDEADTK